MNNVTVTPSRGEPFRAILLGHFTDERGDSMAVLQVPGQVQLQTVHPSRVSPADQPGDATVTALCGYLAELRQRTAFDCDSDGDPLSDRDEDTGEYSEAGAIARRWARLLLEAAQANGLGGCRLCKS